MGSDSLRIGRERLTRVFRFLEALNQHRNPPKLQIREQLWTLWLEDLPAHSTIRLGTSRPKSTASAASNPPEARAEDPFILKVARPNLTRPPDPPPEIRPWLQSGWDDPAQELAVKTSKTESVVRRETLLLRFEDDPSRVSAYDQWKRRRDDWARLELPARSAMKIFENFYELYGRTEREAERVELVLGDGILSWRRPDGAVFHPLLLQRLQLAFDPTIPEFTVAETEHPVELYSALFQSMPDVDGRAIGRCLEELTQGNVHPLDDRSTSAFLKRLVVQLSSHGEYVGSTVLEGEKDYPRIGRAPVLFLRARTLGFAAAIEAIIEDLRDCEELPWSLLNIVGIEEARPIDDSDTPAPSSFAEPADVLLSKSANPEQIRIAQQTDAAGGTLVQGPPGTGKTHTIGNLIGHLLASGKSVLVTSNTTKALRMVRSQVVEKLRSLCVSVLESDLDSRKQLESAVGTIAERLSRVDPKSLAREGDRLAKHRTKLLERLAHLREQLLAARGDEYRDVVVAGRSWPPSDAARFVARGKNLHGWIPKPVTLEAPLPLSSSQIAHLYSTNRSISPEIERELLQQLPDLASLPTPAELENLIRTREQLLSADRSFRSDLWAKSANHATPDSLSSISARVEKAVEPLNGDFRWKLAAVHAGKSGGPHREPWDSLLSQIENADLEIAKSQELLLKHSVSLPEDLPLEEQEKITHEIHAHLTEGNSLNFLTFLTHSAWKQFLQTTSVDGFRPATAEHFRALNGHCRVKTLRRDLAARWDRQMAPLGAPPSHKLGAEIEKTAVQFCEPIRDCLTWSSHTWAPLESELKQSGFRWEKFLAEQPPGVGVTGDLQRLRKAALTGLLPILASRVQHLLWEENQRALSDLREKLSLAKVVAAQSLITAEVYDAVGRLDPESYRTAYTDIVEVQSHTAELQKRNELLAALEHSAPAWSAAIRSRGGVHANPEPPGDPIEAWNWRQLHDELDRRASVSLEELQSSIEKCTEELRHTTVDLIDNLAWAFQAQRTSLAQRQALIGWLDTIRKIGKGTGIRVPRLRAEAAHKMSECRGAVPVWIMPLSRVVENFDPRKSKFDVVIIDEASQSDVMALVALYLGRTVVVVGDHEQVSPSAVGQEIGVVQNLIDQFLHGIPNAHLYDGQTSVYDLARQSFGGTIRLVEHFRCVTEIIQFSNELSYYGNIKPLRDASRVRLKPHALAYRVSGSSTQDKVNRQEAEAVASLIAASLEQPEYQTNSSGGRTSFGVVSLVGEDQALEIDRLLHSHLPPDLYERHRILCGTSAQFQGDERDVVFLSVVDSPTRGPLPFRDQQMFKQRFNVASSRARDQMWVVHSLDPQTDLRAGDLRRRLIEHAQDPGALLRTLEDNERRAQSLFEREVLKRLVLAGYQVTPQWKVGSRRIDLVVEGEGRRLAVECDGDRFHPHEKLGEDMERQAILQRLGWVFARVRGSVFFRDPDRAMKSVFDKLHDLEIHPTHAKPESAAPPADPNELTNRVIRRAEQLRQEWHAPDPQAASA